MAVKVSQRREQQPFDADVIRDESETAPSPAVNLFGIVLIVACVAGALSFMVAALRI